MNIEHFAINVAEPVAMAAWCVKHLGLRVLRSTEAPTYTHFLADETGRTVVEIYHHPKAPVPDYAAIDPFVFHIALASKDVRGDLLRLLAAGCKPAGDPVITPAGDEMVFLHDPWGVGLQLVKRAKPLL